MKEYLAALRQTQEFKNLIEQIRKDCPVVPRHESDPDNTEYWKGQSHMADGFELCLTLFSGETNE